MLKWLRGRIAASDTGVRDDAAPPPPRPLTPRDLYAERRRDEADAAATRALDADPADLDALDVKARVALDRGAARDALAFAERAVAAAPDDARSHVALGCAHALLKRPQPAKTAFERALAVDGDHAEAHLGLGLLALEQRRVDAALASFTAALEADPDLVEAHYRLAGVLLARRDTDRAERHLREAVARDGDHAAAASDLGGLLRDRGRSDEAATLFERALARDQTLAPAAFNLGMVRIEQRRWSDAARLLRQTLAIDPRQADALYWLGNASMGLGDVDAARTAYRASLAIDAQYLEARWGLAMAQLPAVPASDEEQRGAERAFTDEIAKLRSWLRTRQPRDAQRAVGAQQPFYLAYIPGDHRAALASYGDLCAPLMSAWAKKVGVPAPATRAPGAARIRLGIVSAHVHSHSVWHALLRGWLEHLDRTVFEVHLFHVGAARDAETEWAVKRVDSFHHRLGDWTAWAKAVSDRRLDAIVYPEIAMDATTTRLATLRLARVQLAAWGHPITTGLPTIDGYLSADRFEPPAADAHYVERLIRLPRLGCCYVPYGTKPSSVDVAGWAIEPGDRVLLCAGAAFKYPPCHDALFTEIARRCAPCKLVFFRTEPDAIAALFEARLRRAFAAAGVSFDAHVRFIPWQAQAAFFALLDRARVYLDSPGFSGFNTAMQAIERGAPIVAWEGGFMRGRFASAILRELGLDDWVASDGAGFVDRIERLCVDDAARDAYRAEIVARRARLFGDRDAVSALGRALVERVERIDAA